MIRHYLTLEHIARALSTRLAGAEVLELFTQEKFVVTMCFLKDREEIVVTASVDPVSGCVLERTNTHRAHKNTLNVFPVLIGQRCSLVTKHPDDRIVSFWFERHVLHVLLFGSGKGNIVVTENGVVVDALRKGQIAIGDTLPIGSTATPPLGRWYAAEQEHGVHVIEQCRATTTYHVLERGDDVLFSLIPLRDWSMIESTHDLFSALRRTIGLRRTRSRIAAMRSRSTSEVTRRLRRLERSLLAMQADVAMADRAATYRHFGDLLMAAIEPRRTGLSVIDVNDWTGEAVSIPLNDTLSILENAAAYYRRARRAEQGAEDRQRRIPTFQARCEQLRQDLDIIRNTHDLDALQRLHDALMKTERPESSDESRYREFVLDDTYTLYVGRNASNNDELTMRFAKQNDWWMHARGVSGSHAVLRGGGNDRPPKDILERAAAITAYYSSARNATYTPVIYTQRKYVRKPKGANVGAVTLEREQVIMVKPALPPP